MISEERLRVEYGFIKVHVRTGNDDLETRLIRGIKEPEQACAVDGAGLGIAILATVGPVTTRITLIEGNERRSVPAEVDHEWDGRVNLPPGVLLVESFDDSFQTGIDIVASTSFRVHIDWSYSPRTLPPPNPNPAAGPENMTSELMANPAREPFWETVHIYLLRE